MLTCFVFLLNENNAACVTVCICDHNVLSEQKKSPGLLQFPSLFILSASDINSVKQN